MTKEPIIEKTYLPPLALSPWFDKLTMIGINPLALSLSKGKLVFSVHTIETKFAHGRLCNYQVKIKRGG